MISKTYKSDSFPNIYSEWEVVTAAPFPMAAGKKEEESYYGMAKYFCGKEIADKLWLVRLDFPKAPGASLGQGQVFFS